MVPVGTWLGRVNLNKAVRTNYYKGCEFEKWKWRLCLTGQIISHLGSCIRLEGLRENVGEYCSARRTINAVIDW